MFQNLISLEISNEQLKEVHGALAVLEKNLDGLISLSVAERHELAKMGPKSEMFARKPASIRPRHSGGRHAVIRSPQSTQPV